MAKFLDAANPVSVSAMDFALRREQADGFFFYIGGNDTTHAWPADIVRGLLALGWPGCSVWLPYPPTSNATADGQNAASWTRAYGCYFAALDIEAGLLAGARPYCAAWEAAAAGVVTVGYSTIGGVQADEFDFDRLWFADPGNFDPTTLPGAPGTRAVQGGSGSFAGVSYDVTISEWKMGIQDDLRSVLNEGTAAGQPSWASTNQAILATIQSVYNLVSAVLTDVQQVQTAVQQLAAAGVPPATLQPVLDAIVQVKADTAELRARVDKDLA